MSKELEMLDQELKLLQQQKDNLLRKQARAKTDNETKYWQFRIDKFNEKINLFNYIKASLNRLKAIDNANPSEALEVLSFMSGYMIPTANGNKFLKDFCDKEFSTIKQALLKAQEQEKENAEYKKVLEIIVKKKIDVNNFQTSLMVMSNFTYRYYINNSRDYHTCIMFELLTQEEFELIKRWLG